MSPIKRRILQAVLYEVGAISFVGPVFAFIFKQPLDSTLGLAVVLSTIALLWNYAYNGLFEAWEARQANRERTWLRRLIHGTGFEGGLVFLLVPVMAWWLGTSLWVAFITNLGLMAFFFVYAIGFTWAFDKVFGLPSSASG
jgi:uncharacterized membrane protein